jgi:hypothetical protein
VTDALCSTFSSSSTKPSMQYHETVHATDDGCIAMNADVLQLCCSSCSLCICCWPWLHATLSATDLLHFCGLGYHWCTWCTAVAVLHFPPWSLTACAGRCEVWRSVPDADWPQVEPDSGNTWFCEDATWELTRREPFTPACLSDLWTGGEGGEGGQ